MIRKMHCVIAISYLINTDILITFALRQATSTSPPECCYDSGSWMPYIGTTDEVWPFFLTPLFQPPLWELVMKHLLTHSRSWQKPAKQQKAEVCNAISCPSMSHSSGWPCSNTACGSSVALWQTWLKIKATAAFYISRLWRNIRSNMLIYIPKNSLYFYLRKRWRKKPKQQTIPHILILVFFTENKNDRNVHVTLITTPVSHMPSSYHFYMLNHLFILCAYFERCLEQLGLLFKIN